MAKKAILNVGFTLIELLVVIAILAEEGSEMTNGVFFSRCSRGSLPS